MGEPQTMGQVIHDELGIGKAPDKPEANGTADATGIEEMKKEDKKKESVAGLYMVLVRNDASQSWWGEVGPYHINDGDPKKQALAADPALRDAAEDEGVTLKAVPLSSWNNQKTYKYDKVLREID